MKNAAFSQVAEPAISDKLSDMVLSSLVYFSIFRHPLSVQEIVHLHSLHDLAQVRDILSQLQLSRRVYESDGYYAVEAEVKDWVISRQEGEERAKEFLAKIPSVSSFIARFPYVRAVAVSGSLSKGVVHPRGDIDFFVITEAGRLWTCRSFLMLYKKLRLLNSRRYFCLNYFIDTDHLEIPDKNIFTATEMFYLIPVSGNSDVVKTFEEKNVWVNDYFPSYSIARKAGTFVCVNKNTLVETLLNGAFGNRLESFFHRLTYSRWKKKFRHFGKDKFELTMRSTSGTSKHHPRDFQSRVLAQYESKLHEVLNR